MNCRANEEKVFPSPSVFELLDRHFVEARLHFAIAGTPGAAELRVDDDADGVAGDRAINRSHEPQRRSTHATELSLSGSNS